MPPSGEPEAEHGTTLVRAREIAARILSRIRRGRADPTDVAQRAPCAFADGDEIAGRYRVIRFLGRGGAGQVFEVEDHELQERIALKTLHPRSATSPEAIERFKQEILLARSVTHENVCRLFDFGRHAVDGSSEPVFFVTMELLDGETVSERVRRRGAFSPTGALSIAADVAVAMAAAHRQGVIHRDINGSNIHLARRTDGTVRTVVTDFGLALSERDDKGYEVPASSPKLEGTPLFMAPEQVRGGRVTKATDVYAFGVLLFHMLTGRWPFVGESAVSTALARIERDPEPPSRLVPGLDPGVDPLVLRCLAREPEDRWASFDTVAAEIAARCPAETLQRRRTVSKWNTVSAAAALLLTVALLATVAHAALGWWDRMKGSSTPTTIATATTSLRPALVVLGFANKTGRSDSAWMATALAEGFTAALAAGERALVVDGEEAARVRSDLNLDAGDLVAAGDLERIGLRSGARWALTGAYGLAGDSETHGGVELDLHLLRTDGQTSPAPLRFRVTPNGLGATVARASADLLGIVGVDRPTSPEIATASAEQPGDIEAARHYAEGLAALRRFEATSATRSLERAAEIEPDHPLISSAQAEAWMALGFRNRAREAAELAFHNAQSLSREKQLAVEARYQLTINEWQRAEELYRALREFFPDDLDYGLALATAQDKGARLEAAFQTLESLRELPAPWGDDPRIDLTEATVAYHHGDYARSQAAAGRAAKRGRALGSTTLVAEALETDALTRVHTDPTLERVSALLAEAQSLYESVGHQSGLTRVHFIHGAQAHRRDDLETAEQHYRTGLALAERTGHQGDLANGQTSLAIILDRRGQLADGLALKRQILTNYQQRDVKQGEAVMLENLGISLLKLGRPKEAMVQLQEAGAAFEAVADEIGVAWVPYYQGRVWLDLGELDLARRSFERALVNAVGHPAGGLDPYARFELARIALATGALEDAEHQAAGLVDEFKRLEQPGVAAETQVLLARILAARGAWSTAIELALAAQTTLDAQREAPIAAAAAIVVARAGLTLPERDPEPGCADLDRRLVDLEAMDVVLRGRVALARCAWRAAARSPQAIVTEVERIQAEAQALGLFEAALQAGGLHAELLIATGETTRGLAKEAAMKDEARGLGWSG